MMKFLRNKTIQKRIYVVATLLILPAFFFWGVSLSDKTAGGKIPSVLGRLGNRNISVSEYLQNYKAIQHQINLFYGREASQIMRQVNLKQEAWDRILLLDYAKKQNIRASDDEVVDWLTAFPLFSGKGGFDENFYKLYLSQQLHMTAREFEEEVRQFLTISKIQDTLHSKAGVSDEELKKRYNQEHGQRDLAYGVLAAEAQKGDFKVEDKEIEGLYAIVKDKLTAPESVKISYLFVPKDDEEKEKAVFSDTEPSLETLAKKYGLSVKETAYFSKNEAVPEIGFAKEVSSTAFSLPVNQPSDWIRLEKGAYKIRVTDKKAERPLALEETKESLGKVLSQQKAIDAAVKKLETIKEKMASSGFEKALQDEKIEVQHADKFKAGDALPGVAPSEHLDQTLRDLKEGEISRPVATRTEAVIIKVLTDTPADETTFNKEKEAFRKKVLDRKTADQMQTLLMDLRGKLKLDLETMKKLFSSEAE